MARKFAVKGYRRAHQLDRDHAQFVVDTYRQAVAAGGPIVLNPLDPPELQTRFPADPHFLLAELERFARTGSFVEHGDVLAFEDIRINAVLNRLALPPTCTVDKHLEAIQDEFRRSGGVCPSEDALREILRRRREARGL